MREKQLPCRYGEHSVRTESGLAIVGWFLLLLVRCQPNSAQTVTDIYNFSGSDASMFPLSVTMTQGEDGALFGTTGGFNSAVSYGSVFKLSTSGGFKLLHAFIGSDGSEPNGGVTLINDGTLYGTTNLGGSSGFGVLYRISSSGAYKVIHEFLGGTDGASPASPPIDGLDGNLYGTTFGNASTSSTIYKYSRASGSFVTIFQFTQAQGVNSHASLLRGSDGNLYGTTSKGGSAGCGTIFKMSTAGALRWTYSFPCQPGGANPQSPLIQASDGNFYGTTLYGGTDNYGTVFRLGKSGTVSTLYNFQGSLNSGTDGSFAAAGLIQGTDSLLYGATQGGGGLTGNGTLFQISATGRYRQLYVFKNLGQVPQAALYQATNGVLYGTTLEGGRNSDGAVYSLNMGLSPFISLLQYQGRVGGTIQVLGQGLKGSTSVTFNGVDATGFIVVSDTYMTVTVPTGATSGLVSVVTPSGTLTSNKSFKVVGTAGGGKMPSRAQPRKKRSPR